MVASATAQALSLPIAGLLLRRGIGLRFPWTALARLLAAMLLAGGLGWAVRPGFLPLPLADLAALAVSLLAFAYVYGRLGGRDHTDGRGRVRRHAGAVDPQR